MSTVHDATSRACRKCGVVKPIEEFPPRAAGRGGIRTECRACSNAFQNAWRRAKHPPKPPVDFDAPKTCACCGVAKPLDDFTPVKNNRDGRSGTCKACRLATRPDEATRPPDYVRPESKPCTACNVVKPLAEFGPNRRMLDGCQSRCRTCMRAAQKAFYATAEGQIRARAYCRRSRIKYRYGITLDDYERMLAEQCGVCAICGKAPGTAPGSRPLVVDHCHATGAVRGLTCDRCNSALGAFGDTVEGLMRAVAYLQRFES